MRPGRVTEDDTEFGPFCIQLGSTAVGVRTAFGVILAVEKRITSPLIEAASIEKILEV